MMTPPALALMLLLASLPPTPTAPPTVAPSLQSSLPPTAMEAKEFVRRLNEDFLRFTVRNSTAEWIKATYINDDTERNAAAALDDLLAFVERSVKAARRFEGVELDAETARALRLLRVVQALAAPSNPAHRAELSAVASRIDSLYGKARWCGRAGALDGGQRGEGKRCKTLQELSDVLKDARSYEAQLEAWTGWHETSKVMRADYERLVELANEGARDVGFGDLGELWRFGYDTSPADFEQETNRLWLQVKPLYDELHCYVRARLAAKYGPERVPPNGPIPAHLLGNMWAQDWSSLYRELQPFRGEPSLDVTAGLQRRRVDPKGLVRLGEQFFTSLGFSPLPETFWQRSQFVAPRDRDVACHASAWDVTYSNDLRIKMCVQINEEDLLTVHHELGHIYYYASYHRLPALLQQGANDGFHEAIGDAVALSVTPEYLKKLGLIEAASKDERGVINFQMKTALEKIAFLPFGRLIDQWRWDVFSGHTKPSQYNEHWWQLRRELQGVAPPEGQRGEAFFDPGAKYHVPANVPYTRYFLARILQFQFHRALCKISGHKGPLHSCSIAGNREAGAALKRVLEMGASKPWVEALEALTGERAMDATAMLEYFAPLRTWLAEQNRGQRCGW